MTDEEAATRLFMAISDNELWQKMQQSGACIGDLLFIEALVKAIKILGERKQPDATTGLVPCGCGGKPIKTSIGAGLFTQVECPKCGIKTKLIVSGMSEISWNRAMGWEVE